MNERPDIESEPAAPSDEIAKVYTWDGKPLFPFSVGRQTAIQRLVVVGGSEMEAACALVRLCEMEEHQVSIIRGDRVSIFNSELIRWMEENGIGLGPKKEIKTNEIVRIYREILSDIYDAKSITPETSGAPPSAGNG